MYASVVKGDLGRVPAMSLKCQERTLTYRNCDRGGGGSADGRTGVTQAYDRCGNVLHYRFPVGVWGAGVFSRLMQKRDLLSDEDLKDDGNVRPCPPHDEWRVMSPRPPPNAIPPEIICAIFFATPPHLAPPH